MKDNYNSEIRNIVLKHSIELEELASTYVARLLYISNWGKTKSFGYGSSSLSFYQKIQLINDINSSRINDSKIACFIIIRNKLIHTTQFNSLIEVANVYPEVRKIINPEKCDDETILRKNLELLYEEIKMEIHSLNEITTSDAMTILKSKLTESFHNEICQLSNQLNEIRDLIKVEKPNIAEIREVANR